MYNKVFLILVIVIDSFFINKISLSATIKCQQELEKICPSNQYQNEQERQECKKINILAFSIECMMTDKERLIKKRRYEALKAKQERIKKTRVEELKQIKKSSDFVDFSNVDLSNKNEVDEIKKQTLKNSKKSHNSNDINIDEETTNNNTNNEIELQSKNSKRKKRKSRNIGKTRNTTNIFTANNNLSINGLYDNNNNVGNYHYTALGILASVNNFTIARVDYTGGIRPISNQIGNINYYKTIQTKCKDDIDVLCDNHLSSNSAIQSQKYISKCIRVLKKNKMDLSSGCKKFLFSSRNKKSKSKNNFQQQENQNILNSNYNNDFIDVIEEIEDNSLTEEEELKELEMYLIDDYDEFRQNEDDDGMNITMQSGKIVKESQINRLIEKYKDKYEQMSEEGQMAFLNKYFNNK